jgi:stearoyl-CoA desaturase (delta-9 desaturase)
MKLFKRDKTFTEPIVWLTTFFVIAFHVGAMAALFTFAWKPSQEASASGWGSTGC